MTISQSNEAQLLNNLSGKRPLLLRLGLVVLALILLVLAGYFMPNDWTGFREYFTRAPQGFDDQPAKTLWDWLQLLIIPFSLTGIALWLGAEQRKAELDKSNKQREVEQNLAEDSRREGVLQDYLHQLSQLLLEKELLESDAKAPVREVARAYTLAALRRLDGHRKAIVIRYLMDLQLIRASEDQEPILRLDHADLSRCQFVGAYLQGAHLAKCNLDGAYMEKAILEGATLEGASLRGANMNDARLGKANLRSANLEGAHMQSAHLEDAELNDANLKDAELHCAYVDGTHFEDTNVTQDQLVKTKLGAGRSYHE